MAGSEGNWRNGWQRTAAPLTNSRDRSRLIPAPSLATPLHRRFARRSGLLLASSSAAALIIGGAAPLAVAAPCAINVTSGTVASESTAGNVNCINIQNATVTGNVTNTSPFIVAPTGGSINNAILINGATGGGSVVNAGTLTVPGNWAVYLHNSNAAGGDSNSGTISASQAGMAIWRASAFAGDISNSGKITAGTSGIFVSSVSTFTGGITNNGTITGPTLVNGEPLILYGRLAWAHDVMRNPAVGAVFETLPGASFTVYGTPIPRDAALTSAGAKLYLTTSCALIGSFERSFASGAQTYGTSGTVRYAW